jgi:peroxiredoxin
LPLPVHHSCAISGRREKWLSSTGSSGTRRDFFERANVIVNEKQKVIYVKIYPVHSVPDIEEIIRVLKELN